MHVNDITVEYTPIDRSPRLSAEFRKLSGQARVVSGVQVSIIKVMTGEV